jgi:hypothetical protein
MLERAIRPTPDRAIHLPHERAVQRRKMKSVRHRVDPAGSRLR